MVLIINEKAGMLYRASQFDQKSAPFCSYTLTTTPTLFRQHVGVRVLHPQTGTKVPSGPDWFHEIKFDGYRLRVERNGDGVLLITKGGYDSEQALSLDRRSRAAKPTEAIRH
jgi:hypothetical protein